MSEDNAFEKSTVSSKEEENICLMRHTFKDIAMFRVEVSRENKFFI